MVAQRTGSNIMEKFLSLYDDGEIGKTTVYGTIFFAMIKEMSKPLLEYGNGG